MGLDEAGTTDEPMSLLGISPTDEWMAKPREDNTLVFYHQGDCLLRFAYAKEAPWPPPLNRLQDHESDWTFDHYYALVSSHALSMSSSVFQAKFNGRWQKKTIEFRGVEMILCDMDTEDISAWSLILNIIHFKRSQAPLCPSTLIIEEAAILVDQYQLHGCIDGIRDCFPADTPPSAKSLFASYIFQKASLFEEATVHLIKKGTVADFKEAEDMPIPRGIIGKSISNRKY